MVDKKKVGFQRIVTFRSTRRSVGRGAWRGEDRGSHRGERGSSGSASRPDISPYRIAFHRVGFFSKGVNGPGSLA